MRTSPAVRLLWFILALELAACARFRATPAVTPTAPVPFPTAIVRPSATLRAPTAAPATPTVIPSATLSPPPSTATPLPASTADPCLARHTVQPGERLFRIGLQYGVDWREIARANNISDASLIYPGQILCIPSGTPGPTSTPLPPPTPALTPTATQTLEAGSQHPVILTFAAYPPESAPGATVTLVWTSAGGTSALMVEPICCQSNGGNLTRDVPPNGSVKVSLVGAVERDVLVYTLYVMGPGDPGSAAPPQSVEVRLPCPDPYFFDAPAGALACPAGPALSTPAAEQIFEGGRMIWLQSLDTIFVLFGAGRLPTDPGNPPDGYVTYPDTWAPGEPESDPALTPPLDRYQPVRGFGKVWRGDLVPGQSVRDALGWALAPEQPFTAVYQRPWQTCLSAGTDGVARSCSGPGPFYYLRAADGRLIRLAEFGALGRHSVAQWAFWTPGE